MAVPPYSQLGRLLTARLEGEIDRRHNLLREVISREALLRAQAKALKLTNDHGLVHMGLYKLSWKVRRSRRGWDLINDAPYAGVVEHGRRPGRPGPPIDPIREWVRLKLLPNGKIDVAEGESVDDATERAAWAIRNHIHVHGTKPHKILAQVETGYLEEFFYDAVRAHM